MTEYQPGPFPPPIDPRAAEEMAEMREEIEDLEDRQDRDDWEERRRYRSGYGGRDRGHGGAGLHEQIPTRYGNRISVADLLGWLDYRVNELHVALLAEHRHPSRVPGSPVHMSGLDALLNTDATAFRALTELGARLDRVEAKLDTLLARLPER